MRRRKPARRVARAGRRALGKPLAPREVSSSSDDLPKTRNAKVMRRVVRSAYLNQTAGDLSALENPQSVEARTKMRFSRHRQLLVIFCAAVSLFAF